MLHGGDEFSDEFASRLPQNNSFYGKIGNAALVRGVSDLYSICRNIDSQNVSQRVYEELAKTSQRIFDNHYWLDSEETKDLAALLKEIAKTSELVIDEFEKVQSIRQQSQVAMQQAESEQQALLTQIRPENWQTAEEYVDVLDQLRHQRGHLITLREYRYIDLARLDTLDAELQKANEQLSEKTVEFLSSDDALSPYFDKIESLDKQVQEGTTIAELTPVVESIEQTASGLDLLMELMNTLSVADATVRTKIIDAISSVYSRINQSKANAGHKQKSLGSAEAIAQFGAQFKLFSQSIVNALSMATTPEKCEEQLSRLLVQLEELESQFSSFDEFLTDIMDKREEVYETFEGHKQKLIDERQRKAQSVTDAASRMLSSIEKRSMKFTEADDLNTYFATDALLLKVRDMIEKLRDLDSAVKADDIEAKVKAIKEQALRSLRDKSDIYEAGGNVIKLGPRHKFSVNTQELDLTIIPRNDQLYVHLTGTDYFEVITHPALNELKEFWSMSLESETAEIYRAEYLAAQFLTAALASEENLSVDLLRESLHDDAALNALVQQFAAPRYKEGYEKGVHDFDATKLLQAIFPAYELAGLLRFDPTSRALAQLFWSADVLVNQQTEANRWATQAKSALLMRNELNSAAAMTILADELQRTIERFVAENRLAFDPLQQKTAAEYLVEELARDSLEFSVSRYGQSLVDELRHRLSDDSWHQFEQTRSNLKAQPYDLWQTTVSWIYALIQTKQLGDLQHYVPEAAALLITQGQLNHLILDINTELSVSGLMGDHSRISDRTLSFSLDDFLQRSRHHQQVVVPSYHRYLQVRSDIVAEERKALRLHEFKPRPLSSFVRNRLINESYLPIIGDNLAKQMGTVGDSKRTDLMGLLMMISPPGYGKTTLMEYVANRLGLIFMKINCPSLGHDVVSLDPAQAPNATARQELEKLNLALEMGNNVMLYLDDIQHTDAEFLQKFISLCDGTRRIEGIWKGTTKTYDMRGKKFCVVMAGNPYTESGEAFKIPDMLANRADIYNLGDILGGMDEQFALSYIENALTSNQVLAPLAVREMDDVYKLIKMAQGHGIAASDLSHQYSGAEISEMTDILKKMFTVQDVVLKINQEYIASAAKNDQYRTEPSFKLQGSYRNMNKMTEKISAVMNESELMQMIADHYLGEAQLLTTGAEDNLLKLAELRGNMTPEQSQRWDDIKKDFLRNKAMGGDGDVGGRVVAQLVDLAEGVSSLGEVMARPDKSQLVMMNQLVKAVEGIQVGHDTGADADDLKAIASQLVKAITSNQPNVEVVNQPVPGLDLLLKMLVKSIEESIFPIMHTMDKKLDIDLRTHDRMNEIKAQLDEVCNFIGSNG